MTLDPLGGTTKLCDDLKCPHKMKWNELENQASVLWEIITVEVYIFKEGGKCHL